MEEFGCCDLVVPSSKGRMVCLPTALSTSAVCSLAGLQSEFLSSGDSQYKGGSVGLSRSVCALAKGVTLVSAVALVNHAVVGSFPLMLSLLLKTQWS